jgi:hypothetical protein
MTIQFEDLSPQDRTLQILIFGHPIALRHYQKIQHKQGFAEVNDWSKIVQPPESGQSMSMLIKTLQ